MEGELGTQGSSPGRGHRGPSVVGTLAVEKRESHVTTRQGCSCLYPLLKLVPQLTPKNPFIAAHVYWEPTVLRNLHASQV